ncbi:hypothetical protein HMI54_000650 [Coelomomyces lativittatus]|nr:hypothetical protein HMI56_005570 [Coelomomyces lativittatus]KAJ1511620.1 hypothetical protein HMI54_000650 [Coelomomyces lativittatus]KAJ1515416.1 hypothetical protein HMI55_003722 [Coelomomyces lativittatus]
MDEKVRDEDAEDNFHFIAYVPIDGCIYELDGLLGGPVQVGKFDVSESKSWVRNLLPVLEHRMNSYYGREIRFSILSVIRSKLDRLEEQLKKVNEQAQNGTLSMEVAENERNLLLSKIIEQKEKHQRYKKENACRRHNFVPLIFEILKQMSSEGCLHTAVKSAQQKKQDRLEGKGWFPY